MSERRTHRTSPSIWIRVLRTIGLVALILVGVYLYQPQRYDFFPRPAPTPNPSIDPDSKEFFKEGDRVAVVAAHPDDPEYYIAGTLLKLHRAGAKISIVMCTDGDKGYYPWFLTNAEENRRVRRAEQLAAAQQYGANVYFLGRRDGRLKADDALIEAVRDKLLKIKPQYVLTFDPEYPPKVQHSDHIQSGDAAIQASRGIPGLTWILLFGTHAPTFVVDVSKDWEHRLSQLAVHKSQWTGEKLQLIQSTIEDRSSREGEPKGFEYGEAFRTLPKS